MKKTIMQRVISTMLTIAMLLSMVPMTSFATDGPENVALGADVKVYHGVNYDNGMSLEDCEYTTYPANATGAPSDITDGNKSSYVYPGYIWSRFIYIIDLGEDVEDINKVVTSFVSDGTHGVPRDYAVSVKAEAETDWTRVATYQGAENPSGIPEIEHTFTNSTVRYVRVEGLTDVDGRAMFLSEVEVYSDPDVNIQGGGSGSATLENLALTPGTTARGIRNDGTTIEHIAGRDDNFLAEKMIDGDYDNEAIPGAGHEVGWDFIVEMPQAVEGVNTIRVYHSKIAHQVAPNYSVWVSPDGSTWEQVASVTEAPGTVDPNSYSYGSSNKEITFPDKTVKAIMFKDDTNINFIRVAEVEIFADPNLDIQEDLSGNLAFGKPVTLSTSGFMPCPGAPAGISAVTDGNKTVSYYGSAGLYSHVYQVNLGKVVEGINEVQVSFVKNGQHGEPQNYDVLVSEDGVMWKSVADVTGTNTDAITTRTINFPNQTAQYVAVRGYTPESKANAMFISEIEVFVNPEVDLEDESLENLALGGTVKAYTSNGVELPKSHLENADGTGTYIFKHVTDGNEATGANAGKLGDPDGDLEVGWAPTVELPEATTIDRIRVVFEQRLIPSSYDIQVSYDGTAWNKIATVEGDEIIHIEDFEPTLAKFIRLKDNAKNTYMQVVELQAFNVSGVQVLPPIAAPTVELLNGTAAVEGWTVTNWVKDLADTVKLKVTKNDPQSTLTVTVNGKEHNPRNSIVIAQEGEIEVVVTSTKEDYEDLIQKFKIIVGPENALKDFASNAIAINAYDKDGFKLTETTDGNGLENIVDGAINTYAEGAKNGVAEPGWYADVAIAKDRDPDRAKINTIRVVFEENGIPEKFEVLVSKDGYIYESLGVFENPEEAVCRIETEKRELTNVRVKDLSGTFAMRLAEVNIMINPALNSDENLLEGIIVSPYSQSGTFLPDSHPGETPDAHSVEKATDGDWDTYIVPNLDGTQTAFDGYYVVADLGAPRKIDTIIAKYGYVQTTSLNSRIQISEDGKAWTTVYEEYEQPYGEYSTKTVEFPAVMARYIKVVDINGGSFMCFYELEAYFKGRLEEEPQKTPFVNPQTSARFLLADDSGAVLSYDDEFAPSKAVDGDLSTYATISGKSNYALEVDLGDVRQNVNEIEVFFGAEGDASKTTPANYAIEVSSDGIGWRALSVVDNQEKYSRAQFYPQAMRYVRVRDLTESDNVMQIGEIKVNHTTAKYIMPKLALVGMYPNSGSFFMNPEQKVKMYFNSPIDSITTVANAFWMLDVSGGSAAVMTPKITLDKTGMVVTLDCGTLKSNTRYYVQIDYGVLGVDPTSITGMLATDIWQQDLGDNAVAVEGVVASYVDKDGNPLPDGDERSAQLAVDGNKETMAMADTSLLDNDAWGLQVELPETAQSIGRAVISFGKFNYDKDYTPEKFTIYTSENGEDWDFVRTWSPSIKNPLADIIFKTRRVKFVRVVAEDASTTKMAISEIELYKMDNYENSWLEVVEVTPANGAEEVALNEKITVEFSRILNSDIEIAKQLVMDGVSIVDATDNSEVEFVIEKIDSTDTKFTLAPVAPLNQDTKYRIVIDETVIALDNDFKDVTFGTYRGTLSNEGNKLDPSKATAKLLPPEVTGSSVGVTELATFQNKVYAIDNNYNTSVGAVGRWQWQLEVDLGEAVYNANEVRVHFLDDPASKTEGIPSSYEIYVSQDGDEWTMVAQRRQAQENKKQMVYAQFDPTAIRYVRVKDTYDYSYGRYSSQNVPYDGEIGKYNKQITMCVAEVEVYADDTLPLPEQTILSVEPKEGSGKVALDANVYINFMNSVEDLDAVKASISLETATGIKIASDYSLENNGTRLVIDPVNDFDENSQYVIKIDGENLLGQEYPETRFYTTLEATTKENVAKDARVYFVHPRVEGYFDRDGLRAGDKGAVDPDILRESAGNFEHHAIDGNYETGACASGQYNYHLDLDLGEVKTDINEIRVYFGASDAWPTVTPQEYKVSVSADGTNYTTIKEVSSNRQNHNLPGVAKFNFAAMDVRYVRITDLQEYNYNVNGTRYQMVINELEVYKVDPNEPAQIKANPVNGAVDVSAAIDIEFASNKALPAETSAYLELLDGTPVEATATYNPTTLTMTIEPKELLAFGASYRAVLVRPGEDDMVVEFTVEDITEFVITTTSSTEYNDTYLPGGEVVRGDQENAIYPAYVDNIVYQSWTLYGPKRYFQLAQQGGIGEVTWKVTSGALPTGLELTSDGKIQGTPTEEGDFKFKVTATDEMGRTVTKELVMQAKPYRSKWHHDAKFGLMTQWCASAYPRIATYEDLWKLDARATEFDAEEWADIAEAMGAKIFNCIAWAGDGVRMWPSKAPSKLNLSTKRDFLQEIIDAMHARGIKVVAYVPCGFFWNKDLTDSGVDGVPQTLNAALLPELIDKGIDGIWFDSDGSIGNAHNFNWDINIPIMRTKNPDLIFGSNPVGRQGTWALQYPNNDFIIHEGGYGGDAGLADQYAKWSPTTKKISTEMDAMFQPDWVDMGESSRKEHLSPEAVIEHIKMNWNHDATYMLNMATLSDGTLVYEPFLEDFLEIGKWVRENIDSYDFGVEKRKVQIDPVDANDVSLTAFKSTDNNSQSMIKSVQDGNIDNWDSYVGIEFVTGQNPVTLTHLGRYVLDGNNQVHRLRLAKQGFKLDVIRDVEIDLSTAEVDEDGFAYVEIEPITLDKSAVYYIMSSEDTSDTYAKPDTTKITSDYGIIANSPVWCDYSGTRVMTNYGPGNYVMTWPYMATPSDASGGGLTNFKAVVDDAVHDGNLAFGSAAVIQTPSGGLTDVSSSGRGSSFAQQAVDQNIDTMTLAGDGNWAYSLRLDMGVVRKDISEITVKYWNGFSSCAITVYASNDEIHWEEVHEEANAKSVDQITMKFEEPVDARYLRIRNYRLEGSKDAEFGCLVATAEVVVKTNNVAGGSTPTMMNYLGTAAVSESEEVLSFVNFATDQNPRTSMKAATAGTAIKLDFGRWIDIEQIDVDTQNTDLEYLVSADGKTWEALDDSKIEYTEGNKVVFKEVGVKDTPQQAKFMLVRSTDKSQVLDITDIYVVGETSKKPPREEDPKPEQPPVGGGGGGSSSGDSSTGSTTTPAPEVVAPDVKHGWAKTENGEWTYGNEDGKATIGWANIHGLWYYFDADGIMQTGWLKDIDGNWYYLTSDGSMATGWVHDGNTWYYTNSSGVMQTGWIMVDSKWYYLNSSGAMVTGWRQIGASWYYMAPNGAMLTGWQLIDGKWYYMHSTGSMAFNQWIETNGKWYYVTSDGSMAVNTTIGTYKVDENGVWVD